MWVYDQDITVIGATKSHLMGKGNSSYPVINEIDSDDKCNPLICPAPSKRHDGGAGYKSLADNLLTFNELREVVGVNIEGLDEGEGIERTLTTRQAKWHKSCRVRYDNLKLQRAQKRKESSGQEAGSGTSASSTKRTRSNTTCVDSMINALCFFCHQDLGQQHHQVQTLGVDKHVRQAAELLEDTALLAQLSEGDMVAREAKYHKRCLTFLYNRASAVSETEKRETTYETVVSSLLNQRVHSTRLKKRILAQFPNMQEHNKGRDILLAFEDDIGDALAKACEYDHDNDAVHLLRAAQIRNFARDEVDKEGVWLESVRQLYVRNDEGIPNAVSWAAHHARSFSGNDTPFTGCCQSRNHLGPTIVCNSTCCDVNVLRKKLLSRKSRSLEHLPPTRAALEQHIKRAAYQVGHIWGQGAIAFVILPSPCDWGWMKSGDELEPLWTTLSEVSKSCHELISCGCRKHCGGKCRCKKAALKCTGLCACEGGC
ncbi:hypothetical protein Hamer_G007018 [Homarus americanus]|uniref:Tesmin/TSO1-like CXC domain-containing protein n=1 Tax=Homarus americanus TaxID=6706 RepID=A0A8J5N450_HOMAM|nr:hypothetical protein Hamer_G007018 [Homarus americanus]